MSDLIDLDVSSETLPRMALAAPLLPCPSDINDTPRPSLGPDDNPFDRLTREADCYIRRSMDPFEIVSRPETSNIAKNRYPNITKLNRSLDRPLFSQPVNNQLSKIDSTNINTNKAMQRLDYIDIAVVIDPPSPQDLSILNESTMNDGLLEEEPIEYASLFSDRVAKGSSINMLKSNSFSQGLSSSFLSTCSSVNSVSSGGSDVMNKAFIANNSSVSSNRGLNSSGISTSSKSDINDLLQKYRNIRREEENEEGQLIDIGGEKKDNVISGNFGSELMNKCLGDSEVDFIIEEAEAVSKALNSMMIENPIDKADDFISSFSQPDFNILPPSDDETEDLIELPRSPYKKSEVTEEKQNVNEMELACSQIQKEENIVQEVETDLFSLTDPKKRQFALTRIVELKNLVKANKPDVAKLLDDLENILGLNCKNNTELLATCLQGTNDLNKTNRQNSEEDNEKETNINDEEIINNMSNEKEINKCNKSVNLGEEEIKNETEEQPVSTDKANDLKSVFGNLEKLLQDPTTIDTSTKDILLSLNAILNKLHNSSRRSQLQLHNKIKERSRSEVRRSRLLGSPRRSFTPEEKSISNSRVLRRSNSTLNSLPEPRTPVLGSRSKTSLKLSMGDGIKRFSSDTSIEKLKKDSSISLKSLNTLKSDSKGKQGLIPEISIPKTKLVTDIKSKLKRKPEVQQVVKKGPLKAIIPVNNMQKNKSSISKKETTASPMKNMNSLLNTSGNHPIATSTPVIRRSVSHIKPRKLDSSGKHDSPSKLHLPTPKSKNEFLKPKHSPRRSGLKIPSPIKYPSSPRRDVPKCSKSMLPRYSPQTNFCKSGLTKTQSNPNLQGIRKIFTPKQMLLSPLRTNNQNIPLRKPFLVPKSRNIGNDLVDEKENQY